MQAVAHEEFGSRTPMLDNDGRARPELFVRDRLHLSPEGYALWRQVISAHLKP